MIAFFFFNLYDIDSTSGSSKIFENLSGDKLGNKDLGRTFMYVHNRKYFHWCCIKLRELWLNGELCLK